MRAAPQCLRHHPQVTQACFDDPSNQLVRADAAAPGKRYIYLTGKESSIAGKWALPAGKACPDGCMLQWVSGWSRAWDSMGCGAALRPRAQCASCGARAACHARVHAPCILMICLATYPERTLTHTLLPVWPPDW
jgi:hypothetical protein